jgi:hypothetical protein
VPRLEHQLSTHGNSIFQKISRTSYALANYLKPRKCIFVIVLVYFMFCVHVDVLFFIFLWRENASQIASRPKVQSFPAAEMKIPSKHRRSFMFHRQTSHPKLRRWLMWTSNNHAILMGNCDKEEWRKCFESANEEKFFRAFKIRRNTTTTNDLNFSGEYFLCFFFLGAHRLIKHHPAKLFLGFFIQFTLL